MEVKGKFKEVTVSVPVSIARFIISWFGTIILCIIVLFGIIASIEPEIIYRIIDIVSY